MAPARPDEPAPDSATCTLAGVAELRDDSRPASQPIKPSPPDLKPRHRVAATTDALPSEGSASGPEPVPAVETVAVVPVVPGASAVPRAPVSTVVAPPSAVAVAERWRAENILLTDARTWDAVSLDAVDRALSALPARIRAQLGNRALGPLYITVSTSGRAPSGQQPYGGMANYSSTNSGRNELVVAPSQGVQAVLHELGHAYNLRNVPVASYARVLLEPEMRGFLAAAGWQVLTPDETIRGLRDQSAVALAYTGANIWPRLSRNDPLEDFASSFALYFVDPASLHRLSSSRYDWFERAVGRLSLVSRPTLRPR